MTAQLDGAILENSARGVALGLEHIIKATLPNGRLTLSSLHLGVRSWRQLQERSFEFSPEPRVHREDGEEISYYEVNGALERIDGLELVRVTRLELGRARDLVLPAVVGVIFGEDPAVELSLVLRVGPVTVFGDIAGGQPPGTDEATALAGRFLDLEDYRVETGGKHVRFVPRP